MGISLTESRRRILLNTPHIEAASGNIVTFSTDIAAPLKSCVVTINPVQRGSGNPSPDNVRPISGWTESNVYVRRINLWDGVWENGDISESTGRNSGTSTSRFRSKNYIPFPTGNSVYFYSPNRTGAFRQFYYDKDRNYLGYSASSWKSVINAPVTASYSSRIRFIRFRVAATHSANDDAISVNVPSSNHGSYAYAGDSKTLSWENEAGTVYGGTLNLLTGVLTVTWWAVDLGTLTWASHASVSDVYQTNASSIRKWKRISIGGIGNAICSSFILTTSALGGVDAIDNSIAMGTGNSTNMYVHASGYSTITDFQTAMSGVLLVYELDTPVTYQLTPQQVSTLKGVNNIWADCGPVNIKYWTH